MQITDIRIRVINKDSKMKAVVSVTFDDAFVVHDIKVIEGDKGLFIAHTSPKSCPAKRLSYLRGSDERCHGIPHLVCVCLAWQ